VRNKAWKPGPDAIDVAVGERVRARRRALDMSQATLATHLGVSFQQVQKYERGANRISGSTLVRTAAALGLPVQHLLDPGADELPPDARELLTVFRAIDGKRQRQAIIAIAKVVAGLAEL
jgi:transcriptional regulator with XRE-family HTH domain